MYAIPVTLDDADGCTADTPTANAGVSAHMKEIPSMELWPAAPHGPTLATARDPKTVLLHDSSIYVKMIAMSHEKRRGKLSPDPLSRLWADFTIFYGEVQTF